MAADSLTKYLKGRKCQGFTPHPFYSKEGDFLTYYFQEEECYAERIDDLLTVYLSIKGEGFVVFKLKGVKYLLDTLGDFGCGVFDGKGKLMLGMLFLAGAYKGAAPEAIEHYRRLGEATKAVPLEGSLLPV
jgi:hypothetical protein